MSWRSFTLTTLLLGKPPRGIYQRLVYCLLPLTQITDNCSCRRGEGLWNIFIFKSSRKNVLDVGVDLIVTCKSSCKAASLQHTFGLIYINSSYITVPWIHLQDNRLPLRLRYVCRTEVAVSSHHLFQWASDSPWLGMICWAEIESEN